MCVCIPTPRGCNLARREIVRVITTQDRLPLSVSEKYSPAHCLTDKQSFIFAEEKTFKSRLDPFFLEASVIL